MRFAFVLALLLVTSACFGADDLPKATRVIEGRKTTFPEMTLAEGVKAVAGALESCHTISDVTSPYSADDLKKARKGDHFSMVFTTSLQVEVLRRKLEVSEVVFADGAFWLLCGNEVVRCTKYEFDKFDRFRKWSRQTLPVD